MNTAFVIRVFILVTFLVCLGSSATIKDSKKPRQPEHPGCFIWWFLKGCPLGDYVAVDPLRIYPWKKFCTRYSAFDEMEQCQKYKPKNKEPVEEVVIEEDDQVDDEKLDANKDLIENTAENIDEVEEQVLEAIENVVKSAEAEDDEDILRDPKELPYMKKHSISKKCRLNSDFYQNNFKICRYFIGKPSKRQRRDLKYIPQHPGCMHFWFLKGCPLGDLIGVDPFLNYPWETLCLYDEMKNLEQCKSLAFENLH